MLNSIYISFFWNCSRELHISRTFKSRFFFCCFLDNKKKEGEKKTKYFLWIQKCSCCSNINEGLYFLEFNFFVFLLLKNEKHSNHDLYTNFLLWANLFFSISSASVKAIAFIWEGLLNLSPQSFLWSPESQKSRAKSTEFEPQPCLEARWYLPFRSLLPLLLFFEIMVMFWNC
jgi:hypothetical protein